MPNWVTNKIQAPEHVIRFMMNAEGRIDFNTIASFEGPNNWDGIYGDSEDAAERACGISVNGNPLLGALQESNRNRINLRTMMDDNFNQFIGMLENFRACGYLHSMEFARDVWGTKWNACEPIANPDEGHCQFDTAWSCPLAVLEKLSARFPDESIMVTYADEDIGSNCGTFTLKNGQMIEKDIAPNWRDMNDAEKAKWKAFAYDVKGLEPDPEDEEDGH